MTALKESRQARRARERRNAKPRSPRDGSWPNDPYLLICRCEDDRGDGFHVLVGVASPEMGDACARDVAAIAARDLPTTRCELVENTEEARRAWAEHSVTRKTRLARYGETLR